MLYPHNPEYKEIDLVESTHKIFNIYMYRKKWVVQMESNQFYICLFTINLMWENVEKIESYLPIIHSHIHSLGK